MFQPPRQQRRAHRPPGARQRRPRPGARPRAALGVLASLGREHGPSRREKLSLPVPAVVCKYL